MDFLKRCWIKCKPVSRRLGNNYMAQILNVSLNFAELMARAKASHSAFSRSNSGVPYLSLTVWINDSPDQYGNDVKVTLNSSKAKKESEGMIYVGNGSTNKASGKKQNQSTAAPVDDLPF